MAINPQIHLISLVDRPDGDKVVSKAKWAIALPRILRPFVIAAIVYLLMRLIGKVGYQALVPTISFGVAVVAVVFLRKIISLGEGFLFKMAQAIAAIALIGTVAFYVKKGNDWESGLVNGLSNAVIGGAVTLGALIAISLMSAFLDNVFRIISLPFTFPVLGLLAFFNNRALVKRGWTLSNGTRIVEFGHEGIKHINCGDERIFVANSKMRAGGNALALGIPLFTYQELYNPSLISQRLEDAYHAQATTAAPTEFQPVEIQHINPATGLPMVGGMGGIDVLGNTYGFDNNQMNHDAMANNGAGNY